MGGGEEERGGRLYSHESWNSFHGQSFTLLQHRRNCTWLPYVVGTETGGTANSLHPPNSLETPRTARCISTSHNFLFFRNSLHFYYILLRSLLTGMFRPHGRNPVTSCPATTT